jgi:hypothetical protein
LSGGGTGGGLYNAPPGKIDAGGGLSVDAPVGTSAGGGRGAPRYSPGVPNLAGLFLGAAQGANTTPLTPIQQEMQKQAMADLQLGGRLGEGELRDISQAIGSRFSARGLGYSPAAAASELLGTDAAMRQRQNERRNFAGNVDAAGFGQQTTNRGFGATYAGLGGQANTAAGQLGAAYAQLNEGARGFDANFGQRGAMFDATNTMQAQMFNASRADSRLAGNRNFFLGGLGAQMDLAGRRAGGQGAGAGLERQASGYSYDPASFVNPYLQYGQDLFNTNYNAAWSAEQNAKQRKADLWAAGMNLVGGAIPRPPTGGT